MNNQSIKKNKASLKLNIKKSWSVKSENSLGLDFKSTFDSNNLQNPLKKSCDSFKSFESLGRRTEQQVNKTFQSLFEFGEKLGEGAHSVVYKCTEVQTDMEYAVKVCKRKDPELLQNMRQTYNVMKELEHPSIAEGVFLYIDQKKMTCRLVTELCKFPDLRHFMGSLPKKQKLSEKKAAKIIEPLLEVLVFMEDQGVCHRDLKPENILYDPETGVIKIIDFELARMQKYNHEKLQLWSNTGTLYYRAPETFKGAYGIPVDTWSVGIIAFELLTGQVPFKSPFYKDTVNKICNQQIDYDKYTHLSISSKIFLKSLLNKNPELRANAREALSSSFLLKNVSNRRHLNRLNSCIQGPHLHTNSDSDEEAKNNNFYDEDTYICQKKSMTKDIGVRICEEI